MFKNKFTGHRNWSDPTISKNLAHFVAHFRPVQLFHFVINPFLAFLSWFSIEVYWTVARLFKTKLLETKIAVWKWFLWFFVSLKLQKTYLINKTGSNGKNTLQTRTFFVSIAAKHNCPSCRFLNYSFFGTTKHSWLLWSFKTVLLKNEF